MRGLLTVLLCALTLGAAPAAASAATVTASPDSGLDTAGTTTVALHGDGFAPFGSINAALCIQGDPRLGNNRCYNGMIVATANLAGSFDAGYAVGWEQVDGAVCRAPHCRLRIVDSQGTTVFVPLTFDAGTAELAVTHTDSPDPAPTGGSVVYTIDLANNGPTTATGVQVRDQLAAAVSFESAAADHGTCAHSGGIVTCQLDDVAAGSHSEVRVTVAAPPSPGSTGQSLATATARQNETDSSDNAFISQGTTVVAAGPPAITASPDENLDRTGQSIAVAGTGFAPNDQVNVSLCIQGDPRLGNNRCYNPTVVTANAGGAFTAPSTVAYTQSDDATCRAPYCRIRAISTDGLRLAFAELDFAGDPADLVVTQTGDPDPVGAGSNLTYTITVANAGPGEANDVRLVDELPGGSELLSTSGAPCTATTTKVVCELGTVAAGASRDVTVTVIAGLVGTATNTGTATSSDDEGGSSADNVDVRHDTTVRTPQIDAATSIADSPDPVLPNGLMTYSINVANGGPDYAVSSVLTHTLPAGASYVSSSASQGSCGHSGGTITCQLGRIKPGATPSLVVTARAGSAGTATSTARIDANGTDANPANNAASTQTTVNTPPVANPNSYTVQPGEVLTIGAPGVLGNDTDADGDALTPTVVSISFAAREWSGLGADGSFSYAAGAGTSAVQHKTVTYYVTDSRGGRSANSTITVTVNPNAGPPDDGGDPPPIRKDGTRGPEWNVNNSYAQNLSSGCSGNNNSWGAAFSERVSIHSGTFDDPTEFSLDNGDELVRWDCKAPNGTRRLAHAICLKDTWRVTATSSQSFQLTAPVDWSTNFAASPFPADANFVVAGKFATVNYANGYNGYACAFNNWRIRNPWFGQGAHWIQWSVARGHMEEVIHTLRAEVYRTQTAWTNANPSLVKTISDTVDFDD